MRILLLSLLLLLTIRPAHAMLPEYDVTEFGQLPILEEGRVKPLDSFARSQLKRMYGQDALPDITATEWLAELIFAPERAYQRRVFNIASPDIVFALGLEPRTGHHYAFIEIYQALQKHSSMLQTLFTKPKEELTFSQEQTLALFEAAEAFSDLSRSLSLTMPLTVIRDPELAKTLGIEPGASVHFMELRKKREALDAITGSDEATALQKTVAEIEKDTATSRLAVIPPQWSNQPNDWYSFWGILTAGYGSPDSARLLESWTGLQSIYQQGDARAWQNAVAALSAQTMAIPGNNASPLRLRLEYHYLHLQPMTLALALYGMTFLLAVLALSRQRLFRRPAIVTLLTGITLHTVGLTMRMIIMGRPPVTSLYESIIFVAFAAVAWGLFLEWRRRDGLGVLLAALVGSVLLTIARRYEMEGDTMKVLSAVLDTNFWLGTHVVAMTIGYASTVAGSAMAHLYLCYRLFRPEQRAIPTELYKNLRGIVLVALFFSALGTILGGIWADQSWGRFWGWDPKENGALLIVLWLAWVIHGRLSGMLRELGVVMGIAGGGIIVSLAWFGVNLLNVGLHSYGFTRHAALNLAAYITVELVFILGSAAVIARRDHKMSPAPH